MSPTPQLFRVDSEKKQSRVAQEVDFSTLGLQERYDIQEWVAANPSILGDDLLIVTKEFSDFDKTRERLDLLAVDRNGRLVIIELKRDDSGADAHWQAIKYASYLDRVTPNEIAHMLATYAVSSEEDAVEKIKAHIGTDDIERLNNDQRIILVSHRFAPEVTSAVLWLNEQTSKDLITCIQLTPYEDVGADALYLLANTIIPVPGAEAYRVQVGGGGGFGLTPVSPSVSYTAEINRVIGDAIDSAERGMQEHVTDQFHRMGRWGYWHLWYSREPWAEWDLMYRVILEKKSMTKDWLIPAGALNEIHGEWAAAIQLNAKRTLPQSVQDSIDNLQVNTSYSLITDDRMVLIGVDDLNNEFINDFADTIRGFIETVTPVIDRAYEEGQFEGLDTGEDDA